MVKHVVLFKFENGEDTLRAKEMLESIDGKMDCLLKMEIGIDFAKTQRSYSLCLITEFKNKKDLEVYNDHEIHIPVKKKLGEMAVSVAVVDYEI